MVIPPSSALPVADSFQLLQALISDGVLVNGAVTQQFQAHRLSTLAVVTLAGV